MKEKNLEIKTDNSKVNALCLEQRDKAIQLLKDIYSDRDDRLEMNRIGEFLEELEDKKFPLKPGAHTNYFATDL